MLIFLKKENLKNLHLNHILEMTKLLKMKKGIMVARRQGQD